VSGCVAGGAVVEAGGGVLAHGRRLQAAALLLRTTVLQSFFKFFYQLAAFPSYISVPLPFGSFSTLFGSFCFLSFFFFAFVFLSSRFLSSFGPLSFGSPSPFSSFFSFTVLRSIYRAEGRGFLWLHMGSKGCGGWSAIWVQLSRFRSLFFG
jgi:hypothetical protein